MSQDQNQTLQIATVSGKLKVGDMVTFPYSPPLWKRLAWQLRLLRKPSKPNLHRFVIVWETTGRSEIEPPT